MSDLESEIARIEPLADDAGFQAEWRAVKAANKGAAGLPDPGSGPASWSTRSRCSTSR